MTSNATATRSVWPAFATATAMLAQFVASKATRDAYFLSTFPASDLPKAMVAAGIVTIAGTVVVSRLLARFGPARVTPWLFAASALALVFIRVQAVSSPGVAASALYLHVALFGALAISAFWSLLNECFDPHAAKSTLARVGAFAAFGGMLGGIGANFVSALVGVENVLLVLAAVHAGCAAGVAVVGRRAEPDAAHDEPGAAASGLAVLKRSSYLQKMAGLVIVAALVDALLDFAFKASAAASFDAGQLIQFFGVYYTVTGVLTFVVQAGLGEGVLRRFGLAGAMSVLPVSVMGLGAVAVLWPRLLTIVVVRAAESVFSNSLYGAGFQLLYTPLAPGEKRPAKPYVDVAAQRAGGIVGGVFIMVLLALAPSLPLSVVVGCAVVVAAGGLAMVIALHGGYVRELERSLRSGTVHLTSSDALDATTAQTLAGTQLSVDRTELLERIRALRAQQTPETADASGGDTAGAVAGAPGSSPPAPEHATVAVDDALFLERAQGLIEGTPEIVTELLRTGQPDPRLASLVIPLLARDDLGNVPLRHLQKLSTRISGQLLDALLHHDLDASVRRELPRTLERCPGAEVLPRLSIAFEDDDPIVRLRAAQTAVRFIARAPMLALPRERVHAWVEGALDTSDQALASAFEGCDAESVRSVFGPAPGAGLRPPRVELAFTLLALGHPLDVVQASVHGVEGGATRLRGTALEYLETTLSAPLFARFFALLKRGDEAPPAPRADRRRDDVAAELLETSRAIAARRLMEDA